jgi:hypothetical protein
MNKSATTDCLRRVVALVKSLPEARAVPAGDGHLSLEVRRKRFGWFLDDHHGDGRLALNLKAARDAKGSLAANAPGRFMCRSISGITAGLASGSIRLRRIGAKSKSFLRTPIAWPHRSGW